MKAAADHDYMPQLDGLRCFAVLAVMFWHFNRTHPINQFIETGTLGVYLFFVLSGFLITRILLRSRQRLHEGVTTVGGTLGRFYARRALRLLPAYALVLVLGTLVGVKAITDGLAWHSFYLTNWYIAGLNEWIGHASHLWTLAIEEQFYLVWPFVILLTPRRILPWLIGALIVSGPAFRAAMMFNGAGNITTRVATPSSIDLLAMGGMLALIESHRALRVAGIGLAVGTLLVAGLVATGNHRFHWWGLVVGPTAVGLIFVAVIAWASRGITGPFRPILEFAPVRYLGRISYGVYLYHNFMPDLYAGTIASIWPVPESLMLRTILFSVMSIAIAMVSWHVVELPVNRLKRLFADPRQRPNIPSPVASHPAPRIKAA